MNIIAYKLSTGEDIICEINGDDLQVSPVQTVINPIAVVMARDPNTGKPGIGFASFPIFSDKEKKSISISREHIVYSYEPPQDMVDNYNQIYGSGIVIPNKQIITGM